jgi:hypothetical protein
MLTPSERTELLQLSWALCDRSITPAQRDRLERLVGRNPEARKLYALYMGMAQTLAWERSSQREVVSSPRTLTAGSDDASSAPVSTAGGLLPFVASVLRGHARTAVLVSAIAAGILLAVGLTALPPLDKVARSVGEFAVATLTGSDECRWGTGERSANLGDRLAPGNLNLEEGLAEVTFDTGAKVVLEGPALFEVQSATRATLHAGKLSARVPPAAVGFAVQTPRGTVVDHGTEFGLVAEQSGWTDVFSFAGSVELTFSDSGTPVPDRRRLGAGQAIRLTETGTSSIPIDSTPFVRTMPTLPAALPRAREMRELVARHPQLLHHYTFEGDRSQGEHLIDRKGSAPLREFAFGAGSISGIKYAAGLDGSTVAFMPQSTGPTSGGAALISLSRIALPPRITVECLVRPSNGWGAGCAIATQGTPDQRGHFLRKSSKGPYFAVAIGRPAREITMPVRFVPGHWYYVATTCAQAGDHTIVNMYVANVSARQESLSQVGGHSHTVPGTYGTLDHLRIGMGSTAKHGPRQVFRGSIDEVAIYGDVLSQAELQERLRILVEDPAGARDGPDMVEPEGDS